MFSDTHMHFKMLNEGDSGFGAKTLEEYAKSNPLFALDIGTKCGDLLDRLDFAEKSINLMGNEKDRAKDFFYFSAGIWPSVEEIKNRRQSMETLENQINAFKENNFFSNHLVAIGECGLDHHWNPSNPDGRNEMDFNQEIYFGERELFSMQLNLAKKMNLPVVVHSRDAFEETLSVIDEAGYHNGIIHCYSYGVDEARRFLERGWYLAFGGAVTYTKKSRMEEMHNLLNLVPDDRLLLETDAPYLSPVPLRGKPNSPLNIHHSYKFIGEHRGQSVEELSEIVDKNVKTLFGI